MAHMKHSVLIPALLSLMPPQLLAGSGWSDYAQVKELTPTTQHRYQVRLDIADNPSSCPNKQTFFQDYDAAGSERMFQVLLEALNSGKRVRLYVTGRCELNGYGEFSAVSIIP